MCRATSATGSRFVWCMNTWCVTHRRHSTRTTWNSICRSSCELQLIFLKSIELILFSTLHLTRPDASLQISTYLIDACSLSIPICVLVCDDAINHTRMMDTRRSGTWRRRSTATLHSRPKGKPQHNYSVASNGSDNQFIFISSLFTTVLRLRLARQRWLRFNNCNHCECVIDCLIGTSPHCIRRPNNTKESSSTARCQV